MSMISDQKRIYVPIRFNHFKCFDTSVFISERKGWQWNTKYFVRIKSATLLQLFLGWSSYKETLFLLAIKLQI